MAGKQGLAAERALWRETRPGCRARTVVGKQCLAAERALWWETRPGCRARTVVEKQGLAAERAVAGNNAWLQRALWRETIAEIQRKGSIENLAIS